MEWDPIPGKETKDTECHHRPQPIPVKRTRPCKRGFFARKVRNTSSWDGTKRTYKGWLVPRLSRPFLLEQVVSGDGRVLQHQPRKKGQARAWTNPRQLLQRAWAAKWLSRNWLRHYPWHWNFFQFCRVHLDLTDAFSKFLYGLCARVGLPLACNTVCPLVLTAESEWDPFRKHTLHCAQFLQQRIQALRFSASFDLWNSLFSANCIWALMNRKCFPLKLLNFPRTKWYVLSIEVQCDPCRSPVYLQLVQFCHSKSTGKSTPLWSYFIQGSLKSLWIYAAAISLSVSMALQSCIPSSALTGLLVLSRTFNLAWPLVLVGCQVANYP